MSHRKYNFIKDPYYEKFYYRSTIYLKPKYFAGKEYRLYILQRASLYGYLILNAEGGVANDNHIKWLVKRDLGIIKRRFSHEGGIANTPIYYTYFYISSKGRKYLQEHIK